MDYQFQSKLLFDKLNSKWSRNANSSLVRVSEIRTLAEILGDGVIFKLDESLAEIEILCGKALGSERANLSETEFQRVELSVKRLQQISNKPGFLKSF